MHRCALELRQDANGIQGFFAALGMHRVVGKLGGRGHVQEVSLAGDSETRFILMQHLRVGQGLLAPQDVCLTSPGPPPLLGKQRRWCAGKSDTVCAPLGARTPAGAGLGYPPLAAHFDDLGRNLTQIPLAVLTAVDRMHDHRIRRGREDQGPAGVPPLSARLLATWLAQAPLLTPESIRRRRQVTIVTVFRQALLQLLHLCAKAGSSAAAAGCVLVPTS